MVYISLIIYNFLSSLNRFRRDDRETSWKILVLLYLRGYHMDVINRTFRIRYWSYLSLCYLLNARNEI